MACPTVEENKKKFSKREVGSAQLAREVSRQLGFPSDGGLIDLISSGSMMEIPITSKDVTNAEAIFGPDPVALKGKSKQSSSDIYVEHPSPSISAKSSQLLHVDILFVHQIPFLLSLSTPLLFLMVDPIEARHAQLIWKALSKQLSLYASKGFTISSILSDHEGGLVALKTNIERLGITINIAGPDQHVPAIENRVKTVKERVRCTLHSLPFQLPLFLLQWVVLFCVTRINLLPSTLRSDKISPRGFHWLEVQLQKGRQTGFRRLL